MFPAVFNHHPPHPMDTGMKRKLGRRFVHKADPTHPQTVYVLFMLIFSIPGLSLYIGYIIGNSYNAKLPREQQLETHLHLNNSTLHSHYLAVDMSGGLGNIMFQYASLVGISKSNAMIPVLDQNSLLLSIFPSVSAKPMGQIQSSVLWSSFIEKDPTKYDKRVLSLNFGRNIFLQGQFQSWRYFDHSKHELRKQFTFLSSTEDTAEQFLSNALILHTERFQATASEVKFVGIHVKKGYDNDDRFLNTQTVSSMGYIKRAINYFGAKFKHIILVVTSDDKNWSKQYLVLQRHLVVFSPHKSASLDLCILSRCNHTILTDGAFGWWAAFLANGETIYQRNIPTKKTPQPQKIIQRDFYYPHWIGL